ncbi:diadenylate cyclase [Tepidiforma flava]|uniref:Diadenylate cyclase n=1 Tax=Tepidiforma flava TaxID=3004094 RepID=A0ABY7M7G3_9CHLR|nr:diadenylate cyclase [Tepidiforma flava]WBL36227.1 diadenylate cyclase [Tepidiforma flava]
MFDLDHVRDVLDQFTFTSAVDVVLIAVLIYAALRLLSGTRAMTQLRGVVALFLVFVVLGRVLDLVVINFLVQHSVTALLVGAVIIFQPEIRRALDRLGRTGLSGWFRTAEYGDVIDAVSRAAGRMAAARHGGIVVIERETGLQDVIETGVPVDARVSPSSSPASSSPTPPPRHGRRHPRPARRRRRLRPPARLRPRRPQPRHPSPRGARHHRNHRCSCRRRLRRDRRNQRRPQRPAHPVPDERRLRAVLEWVLEPDGAAVPSPAEVRA